MLSPNKSKIIFVVNALLKNNNCFAYILRTDRDISKIPMDMNSGKTQAFSSTKFGKNLKDRIVLLKKPKI